MKALVLAGGRGKRLEELTLGRNKCLTPINGKPVIEYSFDAVCATPIEHIVVVVGYRAEDIINTYGTSYKGCKISYVIQYEQKGLVHAIECAQEIIDGDDFMLLLGDEVLLNPRHKEMIAEFSSDDSTFTICGLLDVENRDLIKRTYTVVKDDNGIIYRLVEKPRNPLNEWMGTGDCIFRNEIYNYIPYTPIHHERNEKELPDLIQCAIDDGKIVRSFDICDQYTNINTKDDIAIGEAFFQ